LKNSYASGQYLVTGDTTRLTELKGWLTAHRVASEWNDDSLGNTLLLLVRQSSFVTSLLAAATLMVSLALYWLSVKAKGRALRVLAGVSTWRIQYEDLVGFLAAMSTAAVLCGVVAASYVGLAHGWAFVPYYTWALLTFYAVVIVATMACAVAMSAASWPSAAMLAAREPAVGSLRKVSVVLKAATFALVLAAVAPAYAAYSDADAAAAEQAQWKSLADQVALSFGAGVDEREFQRIMPRVGDLVKDAEGRDAVALSYTWTNERANGELEPYAFLAFANQRWLDLMLGGGQSGGNGESRQEPGLVPVPRDRVPDGVRRFVGEELAFQSRDDVTAADALSKVSFYRYAGPGTFPMSLGGGGDDLAFSNQAIIVVVPSVYDMFNDDYLVSTASSRNLIFTGLGPTQELVARHGLQKEVYVKYVAEEGVLRAQLMAYFAWLQGISLVALVVALGVAALIGAFITAVLKARRDFPLRLAGKPWAEILAGRVVREWSVGVALIGLVILLRGLDGGVLVAVVAVAGLLASPLMHVVAARWAFANVSLRRM
jgi:heme/copper-type cytochrome/quinol oxidase subunit 2